MIRKKKERLGYSMLHIKINRDHKQSLLARQLHSNVAENFFLAKDLKFGSISLPFSVTYAFHLSQFVLNTDLKQFVTFLCVEFRTSYNISRTTTAVCVDSSGVYHILSLLTIIIASTAIWIVTIHR